MRKPTTPLGARRIDRCRATRSMPPTGRLQHPAFEEYVVETLVRSFKELLKAPPHAPCLSLYQPTHRHHPANLQDPIRFRNLLAVLHGSLRQSYPAYEPTPLLHPLRALAEDREFWNYTLDGLAVLTSEGVFRVHRLQRPVPELAIVAESFHVKPLIRILQSADRYQLLALTLRNVRLFEGNRDVLDEVPLSPAVPRTIEDALGSELTEPSLTGSPRTSSGAMMFHGHGSRKDERNVDADRFFRAVDRSIWINHSRPSGLPLLLAALPEHLARFRRISSNPSLADEAIATDPESLGVATLRELAWAAEKPRYLAITAELIDRFHAARANGVAADEPHEVAEAAANGRVATLIVDADQHIRIRFAAAGHISAAQTPDGDDLLDDVSELVLKRGGQVVVLPAERMPTPKCLAAIYRY